MPIEIHADEAAELQEARINVAHDPWMRKRHLGDDVSAEPVDAAFGGEIVDCCRIAAGVAPHPPPPHPPRYPRSPLRFPHRHPRHHPHPQVAPPPPPHPSPHPLPPP